MNKKINTKTQIDRAQDMLDHKPAGNLPIKADAAGTNVLSAAIKQAITRRKFIKTGLAGVIGTMGMLGGMSSALAASSGQQSAQSCPTTGAGSGSKLKNRELREFVFDFSSIENHHHSFVLITGSRRTPIKKISDGNWKKLIRKHPILAHVPRERASHWVRLQMPADAVQLCYVKRFDRRVKDGSWGMPTIFLHHPIYALTESMGLVGAKFGAEFPVPIKWERLGLTRDDILAFGDPVGMDVFKDSSDTASAMVQSNPEMLSGDPTSSAYICSAIINGDPATKQSTTACANAIKKLGCIEPAETFDCSDQTIVPNTSGYGTNIPICNDDFSPPQIALNCFGEKQYVPVYNAAVVSTSGMAISSGLTVAKDDTTLGANVTTKPDPTEGYIWRSQDGVANTDQSDGLGDGSGLGYKTNNLTPGHGYSCEVLKVEEATGLDGVLKIEVKNWFVRYLGIYVRYFDDKGNVLSTDAAGFTQDQINTYFPLKDLDLDTPTDRFVSLLGPEFEILGIPLEQTSKQFTVPVPEAAFTVQIIAGGMGNQNQSEGSSYTDAEIAGKAMTGTLNLGIPTFFMAANAAAGLSPMSAFLRTNANVITILPLVIQGFADVFASLAFDNAKAFEGLGISIAKVLVKQGSSAFIEWFYGFIVEGESVEDAQESVPIVGVIMAAIYALGAAASIAETSAEVAQSPPTYLYDINLVHDINVIVMPDPTDAMGKNWPSTAKTLQVWLQFNNKGTPVTNTFTFPGMTITGPITLKFEGVPLGGMVAASCLVEAESGFTVGIATINPVKNIDENPGTPQTIEFAIEERQIPLDSSTVYSHKEVIVLDAAGDHTWQAAAQPPAETEPSGCSLTDGQLCQLVGLTINSNAGDVGYAWRSYNTQVLNCSNPGSPQQLYQFANISTPDPSSGYFFSGCGFTDPAFVVYDLLNTVNNNYYLDTTSTGPGYKGGIIRQIRLGDSPPDFDDPSSNKAFGKLRFESSALLLHPAGQLISIAADQNKFEVISLPGMHTSDADAPFSQPYGGQGLRPGLMGGPTLAALAPNGSILVLERDNNRIQAFDLNANAIPLFADNQYFVPLRAQSPDVNVTYLDMGVEFKGYIFVLYKLTPKSGAGDPQFVLDIYDPLGSFLATTPNFRAAKLTVNYWRDIFTENFQVLTLPNASLPDVTEPSVSHWIPSTP